MNLYQSALSANAASLGLNWIYNIPYLEKLEKKGEDLLFQKADPAKFKRARKAVNAYPNMDVGDVSLQGEILKWLHEHLNNGGEFTPEAYRKLIYQHIKPGGPYEGWVETYGKQLIYNQLQTSLEVNQSPIEINNEDLIGFIPYLAAKIHDKTNDDAFELAKVFTSNTDYRAFYDVFDVILESDGKNKTDTLNKAIQHAPKHYGFKLASALNSQTPKDILKIVDTSCAIGYALPLIFTIVHHARSFEEACRINTRTGGASSDRGTLIGALMHPFDPAPKHVTDKVNM